MIRGMVIEMNDEQLHTLAQLQAFLAGTLAVDFAVAADERYAFIARTVRRFGYRGLKRADKSVVLRFLERVSGYSRQQLTRLVKRGAVRMPLTKRYRAPRLGFARTYTDADVVLLAQTDSYTARCRAWPLRNSWNVPIACLAMPVTSGWRPFRWRTYTMALGHPVCADVPGTRDTARFGPRRAP